MKDELEYRNVHLLSVVESERHTKWKLEEFAEEQRRQLESLRKEVYIFFYSSEKWAKLKEELESSKGHENDKLLVYSQSIKHLLKSINLVRAHAKG